MVLNFIFFVMSKNVNSLLALVWVMDRKGYRIYGKKALQKLMYFISEAGLADYKFRWWFYGPFSRELYDDMDEYCALGYIIYDNTERGYPLIRVGDMSKIKFSNEGDNLSKINRIVNVLKELSDDFNPTELELIASIHFLRNKDPLISDEEKDDPDKIYKLLKIWKGDKFKPKDIKHTLKKIEKLEKLIASIKNSKDYIN